MSPESKSFDPTKDSMWNGGGAACKHLRATCPTHPNCHTICALCGHPKSWHKEEVLANSFSTSIPFEQVQSALALSNRVGLKKEQHEDFTRFVNTLYEQTYALGEQHGRSVSRGFFALMIYRFIHKLGLSIQEIEQAGITDDEEDRL